MMIVFLLPVATFSQQTVEQKTTAEIQTLIEQRADSLLQKEQNYEKEEMEKFDANLRDATKDLDNAIQERAKIDRKSTRLNSSHRL